MSHGGADAGFRSVLMRFPEQDVTVTILSNLGAFNPTAMARQVASVYLADEIAEAEAARQAASPAEEQPEAAPAGPDDPAIYQDYVGQYMLPDSTVLTISLADDRLMAHLTGGSTVPLLYVSDTTFRVAQPPATVIFHREGPGEVAAATVRLEGQEARAERIPPFDPDAVRLEEYVGLYYSPELETSYTLAVEEDRLVARHIRHDPATLTPDSPDRFAGSEFYLNQVRFERDEQGEITGLRVSNGRVRHLLFERREP